MGRRVCWLNDGFAIQQIVHMLAEKFDIDRFNRFKIKVAIFVKRGFVAVYKVIVHADGDGADAGGEQLDGESFAKRRFASGRGSRNEDDSDFVAAGGDGGGDVGELALVQRFGNEDGFLNTAVFHNFIQRCHAGRANNPQPIIILLKDPCQTGFIGERLQYGGGLTAWELEDEAMIIRP